MRYSNRECLEKLLLALRNGIAPELPDSENAKVALAAAVGGLEELLKREIATPDFLRHLFPVGNALAAEGIDLLATLDAAAASPLREQYLQALAYQPDWTHIAGLQKKYTDLIALIESCARLLFARKTGASAEYQTRISSLLRRNAEWRLEFLELQVNALPKQQAASIEESTLSAPALADFIARQLSVDNGVEVANIHRVLGGYGKETWLFDLKLRSDIQPLVLRRANIAPGVLDRGSWQIAQEFPLIQQLYAEHILVPEPLWMATGSGGTERAFYIARRAAGHASLPRLVAGLLE